MGIIYSFSNVIYAVILVLPQTQHTKKKWMKAEFDPFFFDEDNECEKNENIFFACNENKARKKYKSVANFTRNIEEFQERE